MTVKAAFFSSEGKQSEVDLSSDIFEVQINVPILHEAVKGQLAAARAGTHSTKTRGEVRGGGAKPWRQKGTGRARHGSIREPQWVGGGVAHGPKPRDYSMRINKKAKAQALRSALSDRASEGKVLVVDLPAFEEPETKKAVQLLSTWGADGKTLLIVAKEQEEELLTVWKSFRNLPEVLMVTYPTAYTVLAADTVIFTQPALEALTTQQSERAAKKKTKTSADSASAASAASASNEEALNEQAAKKVEADGGSAAPLQAESARSTRPDSLHRAGGTARIEAGSGVDDPDPAPAPKSEPPAAGTARLEADEVPDAGTGEEEGGAK